MSLSFPCLSLSLVTSTVAMLSYPASVTQSGVASVTTQMAQIQFYTGLLLIVIAMFHLWGTQRGSSLSPRGPYSLKAEGM